MKVPAVRAFYCVFLSTKQWLVKRRICKYAGPAIPAPAHVIVVIEENHSYSQIIGSGRSLY
jgi:hypothetical protein